MKKMLSLSLALCAGLLFGWEADMQNKKLQTGKTLSFSMKRISGFSVSAAAMSRIRFCLSQNSPTESLFWTRQNISKRM